MKKDLQSGVEAALQRNAGLGEGTLGSSVVLGVELEANDIANVGVNSGRGVDQPGITTNDDSGFDNGFSSLYEIVPHLVPCSNGHPSND